MLQAKSWRIGNNCDVVRVRQRRQCSRVAIGEGGRPSKITSGDSIVIRIGDVYVVAKNGTADWLCQRTGRRHRNVCARFGHTIARTDSIRVRIENKCSLTGEEDFNGKEGTRWQRK